jgi:hypothetical protein
MSLLIVPIGLVAVVDVAETEPRLPKVAEFTMPAGAKVRIGAIPCDGGAPKVLPPVLMWTSGTRTWTAGGGTWISGVGTRTLICPAEAACEMTNARPLAAEAACTQLQIRDMATSPIRNKRTTPDGVPETPSSVYLRRIVRLLGSIGKEHNSGVYLIGHNVLARTRRGRAIS